MAVLGNLFEYQSPTMDTTAAPVQGESTIRKSIDDTTALMGKVSSLEDASMRLNRSGEREALMAELKDFIASVPESEYETVVNPETKAVSSQWSGKVNAKLRQMSMKVMEYVARTNDYEFAKTYDQLLGGFVTKGMTGNAAQKAQNQEMARQTGYLLAEEITKAENLYATDKSYNEDNLKRIRELLTQYRSYDVGAYPGSMPKFLADRIGVKQQQDAQTTGYKVEAVNTANKEVEDWVSKRQPMVKKFWDVTNAVNLLGEVGTADSSSLFTVVKLLSSIIEPGMAVTEGEVSGYMGNNAVSAWLNTLTSIKQGISSYFGTESPTLEQVRAATRNMDSATAQKLKELADKLAATAIATWKASATAGIDGMATAIGYDITNKYSGQIDNIEAIKTNVINKLKAKLGIDTVVDIKTIVPNPDAAKIDAEKFVGGGEMATNPLDSQIINGKDLAKRLSPIGERGTVDGERRKVNGKTWEWNAAGDNWRTPANIINTGVTPKPKTAAPKAAPKAKAPAPKPAGRLKVKRF